MSRGQVLGPSPINRSLQPRAPDVGRAVPAQLGYPEWPGALFRLITTAGPLDLTSKGPNAHPRIARPQQR